MAVGSSSVAIHLYSDTQGSLLSSFAYADGDKATRKWHEALVEHAKRTWTAAGKTGTIQSLPYVGQRYAAGQIPPALFGDDTRKIKPGDIVPAGTKEFKVMIREPSGALKVPPTVGALINNYFPAGAEPLIVFIFVP